MTDNGSAYVSAAFGRACRELGLKRCRTSSYRPQTNGKAERFIRTMLTEWAYAGVYGSSPERTAALSAGSSATTPSDDMAPSVTGRRSHGWENSENNGLNNTYPAGFKI